MHLSWQPHLWYSYPSLCRSDDSAPQIHGLPSLIKDKQTMYHTGYGYDQLHLYYHCTISVVYNTTYPYQTFRHRRSSLPITYPEMPASGVPAGHIHQAYSHTLHFPAIPYCRNIYHISFDSYPISHN